MSYGIDIYNDKGKKLKTMDLDANVFDDKFINEGLIHEFILMQQSNARHPIAHSKTRAEVAGSGRKLYKQKGTGNARTGEARSPIRKHGGVAFGPKNTRNYTKDMPKKMRQLAVKGALTLKAQDQSLLGLDSYSSQAIKTKTALEMLKNIGLQDKKVLVVLPTRDEIVIKSMNNIPGVKTLLVNYVNPFDLLTHNKVLFVEDSLEKLSSLYS